MITHALHEATYRPKMAAFDYDWTLVKPKGGRTFPKDIEDWTFLYETVPDRLRRYYDEGYMIVLFTNQTKSWKVDQVIAVMGSLGIPMFVPLGDYKANKAEGKPNPSIFTHFRGENIINIKESFYVGDALGRSGDWSDTDKLFAENIGIPYHSPEDIFYVPEEFTLPDISVSPGELIIMVGFPGSGKSTIADHIAATNDNCVVVSGDIFKTLPKMKKEGLKHVNLSKGLNTLIFDATHSSIKKRHDLCIFAQKINYSVTCIHLTTSMDKSYSRNKCRTDKKQVPRIAYNVYRKYYEEPVEGEGFSLLLV